MLPKYILTIFLLSVISCTAGESTSTGQYSNLLSKSKKQYYENGDLKQAIKHAKIACETIDFPISSDMDYFIDLAMRASNDDWLYSLSIKLAKGGVPLDYFEGVLKEEYLNKFRLSYEMFEKFFQSKFNSNIRTKLKKIYQKDTLFNRRYHEWRTGHLKLTKDELITEALDVFHDFTSLSNSIGFPSESNLGYFVENNKLRVYHELVLIHTYQRGELVFVDDLDSLFLNGYMDAQLYEALKTMRGFGDSSGIENEMSLRYDMFSKN